MTKLNSKTKKISIQNIGDEYGDVGPLPSPLPSLL